MTSRLTHRAVLFYSLELNGPSLPRYPTICKADLTSPEIWNRFCQIFSSGKNDKTFPAEDAYPYQRDLQNLEFHLLDTGHFALEEDAEVIAGHIRAFLTR